MEQSTNIDPLDLRRKNKRFQRELKVSKRKAHKRRNKQNLRLGMLPVYMVARQLSRKACGSKILKFDEFIMPKKFSVFDDPEEAFSAIKTIANKLADPKCRNLKLNYTRCKSYSLATEALLGVLGKTIHFQKKNRGITTHIEGIYPKDIGHSEIVRDLGIVKELDADRKHRLNADVTQQIIFRRERYSTSRGSAHANDDQNKTSQDFVTFINDCLAQALGKQLQEEKRRILKSCISELLDNAERHAIDTSQGKWYIRGHVNFAHSSPACEIAIFNFGKTVLETYEGLPDDHFSLKMHIKPYINKHMHVEGLTDESLTMVASLQPRVSCRNIDERNTCGTGTAELLDFFQNMCEAIVKCGSSDKNIAKPEMVLISGSAWLTFDEKYRLVKSIDENGHEKFLYPFNNSAEGLSVSPDPECVKTFTDGYFPGFMINIRFPLDIQTVV